MYKSGKKRCFYLHGAKLSQKITPCFSWAAFLNEKTSHVVPKYFQVFRYRLDVINIGNSQNSMSWRQTILGNDLSDRNPFCCYMNLKTFETVLGYFYLGLEVHQNYLNVNQCHEISWYHTRYKFARLWLIHEPKNLGYLHYVPEVN